MSKDRIQIDGVWYVKEQDTNTVQELQPSDVTNYIGCVYETDAFCWEATMIYRDDLETLYPDVSVEFTDKRDADRENWIVEYWDNTKWFQGVYNNAPESLVDARATMDVKGINDFRTFLKYIEQRGWIDLSE
jgi:hypothetical protein